MPDSRSDYQFWQWNFLYFSITSDMNDLILVDGKPGTAVVEGESSGCIILCFRERRSRVNESEFAHEQRSGVEIINGIDQTNPDTIFFIFSKPCDCLIWQHVANAF